MLTDDELAAIKARVEAATPGPWESERYRHHQDLVHCTEGERGVPLAVARKDEGESWSQVMLNARFIAHSRSDIPALLAHVEAQAERIKALEMRIQKESEERRLRV